MLSSKLHKKYIVAAGIALILILTIVLAVINQRPSVKLGDMLGYAGQNEMHAALANPVMSYYVEIDREAVRHYFGNKASDTLELNIKGSQGTQQYALQYDRETGSYVNYDIPSVYFTKAELEAGRILEP